MPDFEILAVIVAGGRGRRFAVPALGGGPKALAGLAGTPLIGWVIDRLQAYSMPMVISAGEETTDFEALGLPVIADGGFAGAGPLAGLYAAMQFAARPPQNFPQNFDGVFSVPADTPFLPDDLVPRLVAEASSPAGLAPRFAATEERWHPLIGLWPVALASRLRAYLASGGRAVHDWARTVQAKPVTFAVPENGPDPFFNINTQQDLRQAQDWLKSDPALMPTARHS